MAQEGGIFSEAHLSEEMEAAFLNRRRLGDPYIVFIRQAHGEPGHWLGAVIAVRILVFRAGTGAGTGSV